MTTTTTGTTTTGTIIATNYYAKFSEISRAGQIQAWATWAAAQGSPQKGAPQFSQKYGHFCLKMCSFRIFCLLEFFVRLCCRE